MICIAREKSINATDGKGNMNIQKHLLQIGTLIGIFKSIFPSFLFKLGAGECINVSMVEQVFFAGV